MSNDNTDGNSNNQSRWDARGQRPSGNKADLVDRSLKA